MVAISWLATTQRTLPELAGISDKLNHVLGLRSRWACWPTRSFPQARFGPAKVAALARLRGGHRGGAVTSCRGARHPSSTSLADAAGIGLYAAARPLFLMIPVFRPPPNG